MQGGITLPILFNLYICFDIWGSMPHENCIITYLCDANDLCRNGLTYVRCNTIC